MVNDLWRRVLDYDHLGTRRAVVEALDRAECRAALALGAEGATTPGERRTDLRETCAAGAMARLGTLQALCYQNIHADLHLARMVRQSFNDRDYDLNPDLAEYHHQARYENHGYARTYWKVYRCRSVPPEALQWVEALPPPPREMGAHEGALFNVNPRAITQAEYLLEAARHLGWE